MNTATVKTPPPLRPGPVQVRDILAALVDVHETLDTFYRHQAKDRKGPEHSQLIKEATRERAMAEGIRTFSMENPENALNTWVRFELIPDLKPLETETIQETRFEDCDALMDLEVGLNKLCTAMAQGQHNQRVGELFSDILELEYARSRQRRMGKLFNQEL